MTKMIDVLKRLAELDAGNPNVINPQVVKESADSLAECSGMAPTPSHASINITANSGEEVSGMIKSLMGLAGISPAHASVEQEPVTAIGVDVEDEPNMNSMKDLINAIDSAEEPEMAEDSMNRPYDNSPGEEIGQDGVRQFGDINSGDHKERQKGLPVAKPVDESIVDKLFREYREFVAEGKKITEDNDDNDDDDDDEYGYDDDDLRDPEPLTPEATIDVIANIAIKMGYKSPDIMEMLDVYDLLRFADRERSRLGLDDDAMEQLKYSWRLIATEKAADRIADKIFIEVGDGDEDEDPADDDVGDLSAANAEISRIQKMRESRNKKGPALKKQNLKKKISEMHFGLPSDATPTPSKGKFTYDSITHPKYGKLSLVNDGGSYMITSPGENGSVIIRALGTQQEIGSKWKAIKQKLGLAKVSEAGKPRNPGQKPFNFDAADLDRLSKIRDLDQLKQEAIALISTESDRPMKPEKVEWFTNAINRAPDGLSIIKMMYDLLLAGDGLGVIGASKGYKSRFKS